MSCAFPQERRTAPRIETVRGLAPSPTLVASILEERELSLVDLQSEFRAQAVCQAKLLESWLGREATALQLRAVLDAQLVQAAEACRQYQDAADAMVRLEIRAETINDRSPWLAGALHSENGRGSRGCSRRRGHATEARSSGAWRPRWLGPDLAGMAMSRCSSAACTTDCCRR